MKNKYLLFISIILLCSRVFPQAENAIEYPGTNACGVATASTFSTITDNFTLEAWVKWNGNTGAVQTIVANGKAANNGYGLYLYTWDSYSNNIAFLLSGIAWYSSTAVLTAGEWTHLALVANSGTWTIYKNGTSIYSTAPSSPNTPGSGFIVASQAATDENKYPFYGTIDEVRFSNTVRYTGTFSVPTAPFSTDGSTLALYHFDEHSSGATVGGATTADASGNGWTLTLRGNGSNWVTSTAPLPVELTSFTANVTSNSVQLKWATATEVNNYGFGIQRTVINNQRSLVSGQLSEWETIGFVNGHGNSNSPKLYNFTDKNVVENGKYFYRLKQIDTDGKYEYSKEIEVDISQPTEFALFQNYPNPFNPSTVISYQLSASSYVSLKIFDVLGNEVATLIDNEWKEAGYNNYQLSIMNYQLPSGVYFYQLRAGNILENKQMMFLK